MEQVRDGFVGLFMLAVLFGRPLIPAYMAKNRGREPVVWYIFGFFSWLLAVILVLVLPNVKDQRERDQQVDRRAQRLQEELDSERRRSERYRLEAEQRLDAHDKILGVHTRSGLPGAASVAPLLTDPGDPGEASDGTAAPAT